MVNNEFEVGNNDYFIHYLSHYWPFLAKNANNDGNNNL